jgi:hypothetical protein
MTYIEMLLRIEERQERTLAHNVHSVITDKHRYLRVDGAWVEDTEEGAPEKRVGRGGEFYVWVRPEPPATEEGLLSKETLADVIAKTKEV